MRHLSSFGSCSNVQIDELCERLDIVLPQDYRDFLLTHNGAKPTEKYLTFNSSDIISEDPDLTIGSLFGVNVDDVDDIYFWHNEFGDELPESSIMIGREDNSGFIVLSNQPNLKGIYFWDDAHILSDSSDDGNVYKISDTFTDFIKGLKLIN